MDMVIHMIMTTGMIPITGMDTTTIITITTTTARALPAPRCPACRRTG
ncbi:hypothetical protein SAMN05216376_11167 [Mameliella alba]|nr:hypothetical protein LX94_03696 [Mameliella alba]SDD74579.1 hypothetical protein SAMN05216376_11167 [Mameliella alba]